MDMNAVLDRINAVRKEKNLSEAGLGVAAELSDSTIRNWRRKAEKGEPFSANASTLAKLATYLGVTYEWLVTGEGEGFYDPTGAYDDLPHPPPSLNIDVSALLAERRNVANPPRNLPSDEAGTIRLAIVNDTIQVAATLRRADVDRLIRRLELAREMIADSD